MTTALEPRTDFSYREQGCVVQNYRVDNHTVLLDKMVKIRNTDELQNMRDAKCSLNAGNRSMLLTCKGKPA